MSSPAASEQLLAALSVAGFRRVRAGIFEPVGQLPGWIEPLLAEAGEPGRYHLAARSYFLEHFLEEAEAFWRDDAGPALSSCTWSEPGVPPPGDELQATALSFSGSQFLVVIPAGKTFAEHRAILQQARQGRLEHEALVKEIEKKEVLVHCIVHDLANPLSGILGTLEFLQQEQLGGAARRMVALALEACRRQSMLIRQILDVFSAEAQRLEAISTDPAQAPDLLAVARAAIEQAGVSSARAGVGASIQVEPGELEKRWPIVGERTRLERVFGNLLENSLRHCPRGSVVRVHLRRDGDFAEVWVEDAGSGVPEEAIPHLFKKLAPGRGAIRGKAGLGLYFCRITVERWGGEIGYRRGERGGACFWFRLRFFS